MKKNASRMPQIGDWSFAEKSLQDLAWSGNAELWRIAMPFSRRIFGIIVLAALVLHTTLSSTPPLYSQGRDSAPISAETYLQRLASVDSAIFLDEFEKEFLLLLDQREKQYYEALPLSERRSYIARFWRLRDPDPFTPVHERLEEHLRRRYYARGHFGADQPPYFDARGEIYLKYGRPQDRYVDPGIYMEVNSELSIFLQENEFLGQSSPSDSGVFKREANSGLRSTRQKLTSLLPPGKVIVLENESWSYEHIEPGLVFNFVGHGKKFRLVKDLRKAVTGGRRRDKTLQTAVLYLRRQNVSSAYFNLARNLEEVGRQTRTQFGGLQLNKLDLEIRGALDRSVFNIEEVMRKSPPEAFPREQESPELPFVADIAQFRGEHNRTRIVSGIGMNLGSTNTVVDSGTYPLSEVAYSYILSNRNGEPVARAEYRQKIPMTAWGAASVLGSVASMELNCDPDQYLIFLQAAEINGRRKSVVKLPLTARDFSDSHLMLSDIQFYLQISDASQGVAKPQIIPYPFATALNSIPLIIQFEIYNLSAVGLKKDYRINYNVTETKSDKNLLSKIVKPFRKKEEVSITLSEIRTATQPTSRESLTLDFGKLRPGAYQLEVAVSALQDSSILASVSKSFVLVEGSEQPPP